MPIYTERAAGTYRAKYLGCAEKTLTDKETNEEVVRWLWRFQELSDPTSVGELAKFTGTSMQSPNSNAYRMATGILGHKPQPGDDTEKHVGDVYDVTYAPNQAGNLAIIAVVPVKQAGLPKSTEANDTNGPTTQTVADTLTAAPADGTFVEVKGEPDELPF